MLTRESVDCFVVTMCYEYDIYVWWRWLEPEDMADAYGAAWFFESGEPAGLYLSTAILDWEYDNDILNVIQHEFAHFIAGTKEHNEDFFAACDITGAYKQKYRYIHDISVAHNYYE